MARATRLEPGEFVHSFGDTHLYANHFEQARLQLDLVDACESSSCDVELHGVPRAILRAIIDMRTDASPAAALEELSEAMKTTVFHRDQLTTWFERLEPTPAERARIAPHINE